MERRKEREPLLWTGTHLVYLYTEKKTGGEEGEEEEKKREYGADERMTER